MNAEMKEAINAIAADKGMRPEVLYAVLADALESAYKKMPNAHEYAWVTIDPDTMEYRVIAQDLDDEGEPFGEEFEVTPDNFGRIAALAFKQVLPKVSEKKSANRNTRNMQDVKETLLLELFNKVTVVTHC